MALLDADREQESAVLDQAYEEIGLRVLAATEARGGWPCHQGCDGCCRRLSNPPEVTGAEWERMWQGLQRLPEGVRVEVGARIEALGGRGAQAGEFHTCPFLREATGDCLIYEFRPAACRMYGFYVSRQGNQWCSIIQALDDASEMDGVILGNYDATQRALTQRFGVVRPIGEWYPA